MFQRIVLALDTGEAGAVATSCAICLARNGGGAVHVVHVNVCRCIGRRLPRESPERAAKVVTGALSELQAAGVTATGAAYLTTSFELACTIAAVAESWRADVIVMGSRRRRFAVRPWGGLRGRLARSTALPVLTSAPPLDIGRRDAPAIRAAQRRPEGSPLGS